MECRIIWEIILGIIWDWILEWSIILEGRMHFFLNSEIFQESKNDQNERNDENDQNSVLIYAYFCMVYVRAQTTIKNLLLF